MRRRPALARVVAGPLAAGAMLCAVGCGGGDSRDRGGSANRDVNPGGVEVTGGHPEPAGCGAHLAPRVLPTWARGGFSDPEPRMPHVLGRSGEIAAIVLGNPLTSPPRKSVNNKILWAARDPVDRTQDLRIRAQRYAHGDPIGDPVTRRVPGGPGPSIVNMPAPGCWHLDVRWSGHSDALELRYRPRSTA